MSKYAIIESIIESSLVTSEPSLRFQSYKSVLGPNACTTSLSKSPPEMGPTLFEPMEVSLTQEVLEVPGKYLNKRFIRDSKVCQFDMSISNYNCFKLRNNEKLKRDIISQFSKLMLKHWVFQYEWTVEDTEWEQVLQIYHMVQTLMIKEHQTQPGGCKAIEFTSPCDTKIVVEKTPPNSMVNYRVKISDREHELIPCEKNKDFISKNEDITHYVWEFKVDTSKKYLDDNFKKDGEYYIIDSVKTIKNIERTYQKYRTQVREYGYSSESPYIEPFMILSSDNKSDIMILGEKLSWNEEKLIHKSGDKEDILGKKWKSKVKILRNGNKEDEGLKAEFTLKRLDNYTQSKSLKDTDPYEQFREKLNKKQHSSGDESIRKTILKLFEPQTMKSSRSKVTCSMKRLKDSCQWENLKLQDSMKKYSFKENMDEVTCKNSWIILMNAIDNIVYYITCKGKLNELEFINK